jgi:hypothetical protein
MAVRPRRVVLFALLVVGLLAVLFLTLPITLTPSVRNRLIAALNERFDSKVEVASLRVSVLPRVRVAGEGVVLRYKGRTDVPPMIAIKSFSAEASLFGLIGGPLHLSRVHLTGLEINIPPGGLKMNPGGSGSRRDPSRGEGEVNDDLDDGAKIDRNKVAVVDIPQPPPPLGPEDEKRPQKPSPLIVDEVISENAELRLIRRTADKPARVFVIHHLDMDGVGSNDPWAFEATLRNPTPPGDIITRGTFGPWAADEPSRTPLRGEYNFAQADLGVFKGISGMLASEGKFAGVLERIDVEGRATIPDFTVKTGGHPVKLETRYHATVDGTNGNTWLTPVDATFGKTNVNAKGGVFETQQARGRTVSLDVTMNEARIEDVLRLAIKASRPPMTGDLKLTTKFLLPPGDQDVMDKLNLDGSFHISQARFQGGGVQGKINELSSRARGDLDETPDNVASDLRGSFVMRNGAIAFRSITFGVPGARIALSGTYTLRTETLDFTGTARMDAKLSQMTKGWKSIVLKAVDPLFRRKGDTVIPLNITGTVDNPKFGLDVKRALTRK